MVSEKVALHWFRQDLRIADNPALLSAADYGSLLPIYILDETIPEAFSIGGAGRLWLHHSLKSLNDKLNGNLRCFKGDPETILKDLCEEYDIKHVTWNRAYDPWRIKQDTKIKARLNSISIKVESYNGTLLWEPWETLKADGSPYRVFTPFYKNGCLNANPPRRPLKKPRINYAVGKNDHHSLGILELLKDKPWEREVISNSQIGEDEANKKLEEFLSDGINDYKEGRNFPARKNISGLSPHLHWGEISVNTVWHAAKKQLNIRPNLGENAYHFLSELGWREFSYSLLYYFPSLPTKNLQPRFDRFPWHENPRGLKAWRNGTTGIPIVDAGMRQLWQTGYMHNRLRMIVGSFLVKNLRIHWHHGQAWFWDTLFDADLANNSASWQWIAGCGADAAPYFRIFNPVTQGLKFDPDGSFIRKFVPELANVPTKFIFQPWEAPQTVLAKSGVKLGEDYPEPIVNLKTSRDEALEAFASLKA